MAHTSRRDLCEEHIAELAIIQTKLLHLTQEVTFLASDVRKMMDMIVDHRTQLLMHKDRQKVAMAGIAAFMGLLGSLGPTLVQALLK